MLNDKNKIKLSDKDLEDLFQLLEERFNKHMERHEDIKWEDVGRRLLDNPSKVWSLSEMEKTGGEPDVIAYDKDSDEYIFCDCSIESPIGRRSTCYDKEAREARKKNKPENSAMEMAKNIGIQILTQEQYRELQEIGEFDNKTSSWIKTPDRIRKLGGALFCDRRYDTVFVYHNGADSYYGARGFRGLLRV